MQHQDRNDKSNWSAEHLVIPDYQHFLNTKLGLFEWLAQLSHYISPQCSHALSCSPQCNSRALGV